MSVPGIAPNGKPRPWLDRSRPGESQNNIFGTNTLFFLYLFCHFPLFGGSPWGGAPRFFILVAPGYECILHRHSYCNDEHAVALIHGSLAVPAPVTTAELLSSAWPPKAARLFLRRRARPIRGEVSQAPMRFGACIL